MSDSKIDIDLSGLLEILEGDRESLIQLIDTYICEGKHLLQQMEMQLADKNFDSLQRLAHSFKGMSATVGINSLQSLAFEMEQSAPNKDQNKTLVLFQAMQSKFAEATITLNEMMVAE